MKRPLHRAVGGLIVLACSTLALPVQAQYPNPYAPQMMAPMGVPVAPPMGMPHMGMPTAPGMQPGAFNPLAALNLTDEQREKLGEIGNEARAVSVNLMNKIGNEFEKLRGMFAENPPDAKKIGAVYQAIFDFQRQTVENTIEVYNRQVAILDAEQQKLWNKMREQMLARFMPPAKATK